MTHSSTLMLKCVNDEYCARLSDSISRHALRWTGLRQHGPRLSAVQLGKQTGEERKRAAASTLVALGSLGDILYNLYPFL